MADSTRSKLDLTPAHLQEEVLGDKAVGGTDNDKDHVGNVIGGLKAYVSVLVNDERLF